MRLLLIRHGQSVGNAEWRDAEGPYGYGDPELTALGRAQARRLADAFADGRLPRPDHLLTSLMVRAVETAAPVAEALDLPVIGLPEAHEEGGVFARVPGTDDLEARPGAGRSALLALCPRLVLPPAVTEAGWYFQPVEDRAASWPRAQRVVADLAERYGEGDRVVALVSHGFFTQMLVRALLDWEPDLSTPVLDPWLQVSNTGTLCVWSPGPSGERTRLEWANRTDHLEPDLVTD